MKYKVKLTVIDKKCYPELQERFCADPKSGPCPCYNVGDEFVFYRDGERDDFWHMGLGTLVKTSGDPDKVAGGPKMPHCSELWDALYLFDYGAPVGFRLAMWHPERVTAIISQNGNMYDARLGPKWAARREYWKSPTAELRKKYASAYALDTIVGQYTFGTPSGARTIRHSFRLARRLSSATFPTPKCISSIVGASRSNRTTPKSPSSCASS